MALVFQLPKRKGPSTYSLTEWAYGSELNLRVYSESGTCDGTYAPPSPLGSTTSGENGPGHAVLYGELMEGRDEGEVLLKGEWRHLSGGLGKTGSFEMMLDLLTQTSEGTWSTSGEKKPHPWKWTLSPADIEACIDFQPLVDSQKSKQDVKHVHSSESHTRIRPSMSGRLSRHGSRGLTRASTFFDELLDGETGGSALKIARYGVACAWAFFLQTAAALFFSCLKISGTHAVIAQCAFQAVYTVTYASFLVIYSRMKVLPPVDYVAGVCFYTLGYACFLTLYITVLVVEKGTMGVLLNQLYLAGSLLFLLGSIVLVKATLPAPAPMAIRQLTSLERIYGFALYERDAALFWGSFAFLLGSILFSVDSAFTILFPEGKPASLSFWCVSLGYATFTPGRLYFLWGSTTATCGMFFQDDAWDCVKLIGGARNTCIQLSHSMFGCCSRRPRKVGPGFTDVYSENQDEPEKVEDCSYAARYSCTNAEGPIEQDDVENQQDIRANSSDGVSITLPSCAISPRRPE